MKRFKLLIIPCLLLFWTASSLAYNNGDDIDATSVRYYQVVSYKAGDGQNGFLTADDACRSYARTQTALMERFNKEKDAKLVYEYTGVHTRPQYAQRADAVIGILYNKPPMHKYGTCSIKLSITANGTTAVQEETADLELLVECPKQFYSFFNENEFFCIFDDRLPMPVDPALEKIRIKIKQGNDKYLQEIGGRV